MQLNMYEVFDGFKKEKSEKTRVEYLRKHNTTTLATVLQLAFDPNFKFTTSKTPEYKRDSAPAGMSMSNMPMVIRKAYLFLEGHPKRPILTKQKEEVLLIQILESLEEKEADIWMRMMKKDLGIPYLTENVVRKAFPNLLPPLVY